MVSVGAPSFLHPLTKKKKKKKNVQYNNKTVFLAALVRDIN